MAPFGVDACIKRAQKSTSVVQIFPVTLKSQVCLIELKAHTACCIMMKHGYYNDEPVRMMDLS